MIPVYSNIVKVSVTPYTIDMGMGYILNTDKEETGVVLYSDAPTVTIKDLWGLLLGITSTERRQRSGLG